MKARILSNSMRSGHVARDFIDLARLNLNSSTPDTRLKTKAAHEVLESFEDQNRSLPVDPIVPIKKLVRGMTESLQGIATLIADDDGGIGGANLFKGCPVRLRGIPERRFVIRDIYWDYGEVRVEEIGSDTFYLVPWDCLRLVGEQEG